MPSSKTSRLLASLPATRPSFSLLLWDKVTEDHGTAAKLIKLALAELVVFPDWVELRLQGMATVVKSRSCKSKLRVIT